MLAAPDSRAILPYPNAAFPMHWEVAHCPLCFTPGLLSDRTCRGCGISFEEDVVSCGNCLALTAREARVCPSCSSTLV